MKIRSFILACASVAAAACGQSTEKIAFKVLDESLPQVEKFLYEDNSDAEDIVALFEDTHEAMMTEYRQNMDSLSSDQALAQKYYDEFVEDYVAFNLEAVKRNPGNDVAVQVLMNLRGMIEDEQVAEIIAGMPEQMLENETVARLKQGLDARIATAEGKPFVDFTVNSCVGQSRSIPPQSVYAEVKLSDYVGKGKYILLDFWSPWCGPCRREMPNVKAIYN